MPTAKKKAKRLDPEQLFVIQSTSRASIAESLNLALEDEEGVDHVMHFQPDDPRLTDKVCQEFADTLYDAASDTAMDDAGMCEIEVSRTFVHKFK